MEKKVGGQGGQENGPSQTKMRSEHINSQMNIADISSVLIDKKHNWHILHFTTLVVPLK